jgi:hypothetical protein
VLLEELDEALFEAAEDALAVAPEHFAELRRLAAVGPAL